MSSLDGERLTIGPLLYGTSREPHPKPQTLIQNPLWTCACILLEDRSGTAEALGFRFWGLGSGFRVSEAVAGGELPRRDLT